MSLLARRPRFPRNLEDWFLVEIGRARERLVELRRDHPAALEADLAQRLIDDKKLRAARGGALTGFFGLAAVPADVALLAYLQLTLAIELSLLYGVNPKTSGGRRELFDLLGWEEGAAASLRLFLPALATRAGRSVLRRSAWKLAGRAVPVLAAPLTAWLNHREIQRLGDAAVVSFGAFRRLHPTAAAPTDA